VMIHDDISAHLSLFHLLDFLIELESFLLVDKFLLLRLSSCLSGEAGDIIDGLLVVQSGES